MVADELRRQADHFVELQSLESAIGRESNWRGDREEGEDQDEHDEIDDDDTDESYAHSA